MSEPRGPRTFAVDAAPVPTPPRSPRAISDLDKLDIEPDDALEREALEALDANSARPRPSRKGFSFGKLFIGALGAAVSLGLGLALDALVRDLFARAEWLGWFGLVVAALLVVGVVGIVGREILALMRLKAVEVERRAALHAFETNSDAEPVLKGLDDIVAGLPGTQGGRASLARHRGEVIDGRDLVALAEREILMPLDARARALVLGSAKRVSLVTAVSPRAAVDLLFVLVETIRLIRRMSELYGARPGTVGLVRLTRDVLAHLAVTGSIAVGDGILQQVVGHGVASRLSAKLGEGVVNGLLTARIGLAAMDLCRPMPFMTVRRPTVGDFLNDLTRIGGASKPS